MFLSTLIARMMLADSAIRPEVSEAELVRSALLSDRFSCDVLVKTEHGLLSPYAATQWVVVSTPIRRYKRGES
jgi:hypothetical protein